MREAGRDLEIQMVVLRSLKGQWCKALHMHPHPTVGKNRVGLHLWPNAQ